MDKPKEIFIKNKYREQQSEFNAESHNKKRYHPEYKRLEREPVVFNTDSDFEIMKQRQIKKVISPTVKVSKAASVQAPASVQIGQQEKTFPVQVGAVSGFTQEQVWNNSTDPNGDILAEDIPDFPEKEFESYVEPPNSDGIFNILKNIDDYCYLVIIKEFDFIHFQHKEQAEEFIEKALLDKTLNINMDDVIIIKKLNIKAGIQVT